MHLMTESGAKAPVAPWTCRADAATKLLTKTGKGAGDPCDSEVLALAGLFAADRCQAPVDHTMLDTRLTVASERDRR